MSRPRMKDVAALAGVSIATVSHVINDTRYVEDKTKQRVLLAIEKLNYRPSAVARGLVTQQTNTVGVLVSDITNTFFGEVIRGIEEVFLPTSYALMISSTAEILDREAHYLDLLLKQRVDGIIAAAASKHWNILSQVGQSQTPIVFVDRAFEDLQGCFIGTDNKGGVYKGVDYLIAMGHQRIGILSGFDRLSTMRERYKGYVEALNDAHIELNNDWVCPSELSVEAAYKEMRRLMSLAERPTAVFSNNNLLTLGALLAIKEMSLNCPEDVALVGFDDHPWAEVSNPPLTVIRQPAKEIGKGAANMLLSLIAKEPVEQERIYLPCDLIVRESV